MVSESEKYNPSFHIIKAFEEIYPDSTHGPAHLVISDCNIDSNSLQFALGRCNQYDNDNWTKNYSMEHTEEEIKATIAMLNLLMVIPEEKR